MPKIALLQSKDHGSQDANINNCLKMITKAANNGAQIICSQELFMSDYFCRQQNTSHFALAHKIPGDSLDKFKALAKDKNIVLALSLFEESINGLYYNTSVMIDADGGYLGKYRKMHIPQDPFFEEKFYFTPGDLGVPVFDTAYGKISLIICWDQWFPETSRLACLAGAELIIVPTAIGWLPDEKSTLGEKQLSSWLQVQRGHAVANSCFYAAINRVGTEDPIQFWGNSFACNQYGQVLACASQEKEEILYANIDFSELREHRQAWPFLRDRRIDAYDQLKQRSIES